MLRRIAAPVRRDPWGAPAVLCALRRLTYDVPSWVETLRRDAKSAESSISYDVKIYDEIAWHRKPFTFSKSSWDPNTMSSMLRQKLCIGDEFKEYTVIGEAFPFADRLDSPVMNEPAFPAKLLWDHTSKTEKVMIQLGEQFPPLLWLTVKPTIEALRKVFKEFIEVDAEHMKKYLPYYEEVQNRIETLHRETFGEALADFKMRDAFTDDMRKKDPMSISMDWPNDHNLLLGTVDHFRIAEDKMMRNNPFVFGWPLLVSEGNHFMDDIPLRMAAFRTIYSKSLVLLHTRLDLQVDPRHGDPEDPDAVPNLEVPVMASVNYPTNTRLCGGAALVQRFNRLMGTSYPENMPVDVLGMFAKELTVKGTKEIRAEIDFLAAASEKVPDVERVVRLAPQFHGHNRILGQLAFAIVHLALAEDAGFSDVVSRFEKHQCDMVRLACAKGAQIVMRPDLAETLASREPDGPVKRMMARCAMRPPAK